MDQNNARRGVRNGLIALGCALFALVGASGQTSAAPPPTPTAPSSAPAAPAPVASAPPAVAAVGPASPSTANAATALPAWEVATVKPAAPDARGSMLWFTADGIKITNVPLYMIAREGFGLEDDRIIGGPGWAKTTNFDMEAKVAPEDAPKLKGLPMEERRRMLVSLLQDRCGLKFHHETRDLPVYDLVVAKGGSKLVASKPDPPAEDGGDPKGRHMLMMTGRGHIESTGADIHGLSRILSAQLHRTVIDKTGLTGSFDYKLDWTPDDAPQGMAKAGDAGPGENANSQDNVGPSLFTAIEEQLGLKLESSKGPVDVVVIDALEQPTAN